MPLPQCAGNAGKVMSRSLRGRGGIKLSLNYPVHEAQTMRQTIQRIRLQGDRQPSLSLIARRSMGFYMVHLESSPAAFAKEVEALDGLATPRAHRKVFP